jgi:hypothetical protein
MGHGWLYWQFALATLVDINWNRTNKKQGPAVRKTSVMRVFL